MKKSLFNPLPTKFSVQYDINENGNPLEFTIEPMRVATFDEPIYGHMKMHLVTEIMNVRNLNPTIPKNRTDVIKEVTVEE